MTCVVEAYAAASGRPDVGRDAVGDGEEYHGAVDAQVNADVGFAAVADAVFEGVFNKHGQEHGRHCGAGRFGRFGEPGLDVDFRLGIPATHYAEITSYEADFGRERGCRGVGAVIEHIAHEFRHFEHHLLSSGGVYLDHAVDVVEHVEIEVRRELGAEGRELVFGVDFHQPFAVDAVMGIAEGKGNGDVGAHHHYVNEQPRQQGHGYKSAGRMRAGKNVPGHGPAQMDEVDILEREHGDKQNGCPEQITPHVSLDQEAGDQEIVVESEKQQQGDESGESAEQYHVNGHGHGVVAREVVEYKQHYDQYPDNEVKQVGQKTGRTIHAAKVPNPLPTAKQISQWADSADETVGFLWGMGRM